MNWNLRQLPTGAATRKNGSGTVGASLFWRLVLSLKIRGFGGCYGAVRDAEGDVGGGAAVGWWCGVVCGPWLRC